MNKILHISNTDIATDSRIIKELAVIALIKDTSVYAIGIPERDGKAQKNINRVDYLKIKLQSRLTGILPRSLRYFIEMIEFTLKAIFLGKKINPHIIHCHDTFALPAGWILKKLTSAILIYDAHELESNKNGQNKILSKATLSIEKFCWSEIDLLISVSDSIVTWYLHYLGHKKNLVILNSPVHRISSTKINNEIEHKKYFHNRFGIPSDCLVFLYLGILGEGRGIDKCINAFANNNSLNAHVVFMGFGPLESQIIDLSKRYLNVHFHPAVDHDQVVAIASNANFGLCFIENVSLSDFYCLPNKLFEYCFAGLPVLASDFPEINRLVNDYSLGYCCEPSSKSIYLTLEKIIKTRPTFVPKNLVELSWQSQAQKLKKVYLDILPKKV